MCVHTLTARSSTPAQHNQVNYHAIGMYFVSRGGFALHNPQEEASLKVSAFVLSGASRLVLSCLASCRLPPHWLACVP